MTTLTLDQLPERFRSKVSINQDTCCWEWTGAKSDTGYGRFRCDGFVRAHRYAYSALIGPIPNGLQIDHLCRVRHCVNPAHMEPVTNQVNSRRALTGAHNAAKTHCPHGHEYTEANTYTYNGKRNCRTCRNEQAAKRRDRGDTRLRLAEAPG